jgi:hypothetical protein
MLHSTIRLAPPELGQISAQISWFGRCTLLAQDREGGGGSATPVFIRRLARTEARSRLVSRGEYPAGALD